MDGASDRKVKEITKINMQWQKYSKHQDDILADLRIKQKESNDKIRRLEAALVIAQNQYETMELKYTDAWVRADERKRQLEEVNTEFHQLQHKLQISEQEALCFKIRCADLLKEVDEIQTMNAEEINLYKQQVRMILFPFRNN